METVAYICDYCKKLELGKNMYGINVGNPDLYNIQYTYVLSVSAKGCGLHVCAECIATAVIDPMERMDLKRGTDEHNKVYKEMMQNLMISVHRKKHFK